jgi:hypothetical protein
MPPVRPQVMPPHQLHPLQQRQNVVRALPLVERSMRLCAYLIGQFVELPWCFELLSHVRMQLLSQPS